MAVTFPYSVSQLYLHILEQMSLMSHVIKGLTLPSAGSHSVPLATIFYFILHSHLATPGNCPPTPRLRTTELEDKLCILISNKLCSCSTLSYTVSFSHISITVVVSEEAHITKQFRLQTVENAEARLLSKKIISLPFYSFYLLVYCGF